MYKSIYISGRRWDSNETEPKINTVITAQSGDTAFLPCHVALREDHGVSFTDEPKI